MKFSTTKKLISILSFASILIIWDIYAKLMDKEHLYPRLFSILGKFKDIVVSSDFYSDLAVTLYRSIVVLIVALIVSIIVSLLKTQNKYVKSFIGPYELFFSSLPPLIMVLMFSIIFSKEVTPYALGYLVLIPILITNLTHAIKSVDHKLIEMAKTFNVSKKKIIFDIYFRSVFINVMGSICALFAIAFKFVLAGEVFANPQFGIGTTLNTLKTSFQIAELMAWILIVALISISFYLIQGLLRKYLLKGGGFYENN